MRTAVIDGSIAAQRVEPAQPPRSASKAASALARAVDHVERDVAHLELALLDVRRQQPRGLLGAAPRQRAQDARVLIVGGGYPRALGEIEPPHDADALGDLLV